jgi:hypothetical protein
MWQQQRRTSERGAHHDRAKLVSARLGDPFAEAMPESCEGIRTPKLVSWVVGRTRFTGRE